MPLIDLQTDLKSLRFGKDRFNGGSSGQPYITSPIPEGSSTLGILDNDFLLRGGITAVTNSGTDVLRLGKMFIDTKSPSGILFTAKQQLLSRTSNRTQTSGILNEGIYTPLSTLAQAGVNAFGGHLNKQGINPFSQTGAYSNNDNLYGVKVKSTQPKSENRLVSLYQNITDKTSVSNWNFSGVDLNVGPNILSYGGGPGSILGIGKTNIRFASPEQRTGTQNPLAVSNPTFFYGNASGSHQPQGTNYLDQIIKGGATEAYIKEIGFYDPNLLDDLVNDEGQIIRGGQDKTGDKNALATTNPTYFYGNATGSHQTQGANYLDQIIKSGATADYIRRTGSYDPNLLEGLVNSEGQIIRGGQDQTGEFNALATTNPTYFYTGSIPQRDLPKYIDTDNLLNLKNIYASGNSTTANGFPILEEYKTLSSPPQINASTNTLNVKGENINPSTLSTSQLNDAIDESTIQTGYNGGIKQDFRAELRKNIANSQILSNSPSYIGSDNKSIEGPGGSRIAYNSPTNPLRNLINYSSGSGQGPVDKVNALPIYRKSVVTEKEELKNDLVKFRIAIIDNDNPSFKNFIHFRAYLGSISDNYTATWNPTKYLGRGEEFYTYGGFGRTVSLDWTVAAQSKEELIPMYKKLNYLASSLAPDYSGNGYMKGNLAQLTVGGYFYEQPGFITGLNLSINDDSPYEIGINSNGGLDSSVKELPMIIRVTGFNFTPIHNFRPSIQTITNPMSNASLTDTNTYGNERYIALSNGSNNNY